MREVDIFCRKKYKRYLFFYKNSNVYRWVMKGEEIKTEEQDMIDAIIRANREWKNAEAYFQTVTDEDLIDYAIHRSEAAKYKYIYLIKLAKKMGLTNKYKIK